jgi:surface protein
VCNAAVYEIEADAGLQGKVDEWLLNKQEALAKYGPIGEWDTSNASSLSNLFGDAHMFDEDLSAWDVSQVRNMADLFRNNFQFTSDLSAWDLSRVTTTQRMFAGNSRFTSDLSRWDVSAVERMDSMFVGALAFTADLSAWDVSAVKSMPKMFAGAFSLTTDISLWDVSNVEDMNYMLVGALQFRSDLSSWDVSAVTQATGMMNSASAFTSDLSSWDVSQITDMIYMFSEASQFTSDVSKWQVQDNAVTEGIFDGTRMLNDYGVNLPCWATSAVCALPITFTGVRTPLKPALGVTTVDPTEMSATSTYRVGTTYRIAPLAIKDIDRTYNLVGAPDGFFINPETGVVLGTFGPDDVTIDQSAGGGNKEPLTMTLQVMESFGSRRAEVETYTMHVQTREKFELVLGDQITDASHFGQYYHDLPIGTDGSALVLVGMPFRAAARVVDENETTLSEGGFEDITFTFNVFDTSTGNPIGKALDRLSIKPNGELLGTFSAVESGKLTIVITAADGGGQRFAMTPIMLDIRQLDVDIPSFGPNNKTCANQGILVDEPSELFDGKFTCNCDASRFVGENCDELCPARTTKNYDTGVCDDESSLSNSRSNANSNALAFAAGALVLALLLTIGAVRYRKYRRSKRPVDFDEINLEMLGNGIIMDGQLISEMKPRELKRSNVVLLEQVGSGSFGAVWKAMLDESHATRRPEYLVAAKTVLEGAPAEARADLMTEAAAMAQLAGHKNLVSIIGVVTSGNPLILVLSYCDHGSMLTHLAKCVATGKAVSMEHKLDFAAQTARGMEHLAGRRFVHRDLAARNVLLSSGQSASNLVCKVADFGLSRVGTSGGGKGAPDDTDYYRSQKGVFPVRWTAPEAMESLTFNQASDVWSFGILLIELIQDGDRPYHSLRINSDVMLLTMTGRRHHQPPGCSDELYAIMMRCWDAEPKKRPLFTGLVAELDQMHKHVTVWGAVNGHNASTHELSDSGVGAGTVQSVLANGVEYAPLLRGESSAGSAHIVPVMYSDPSVGAGTPQDVVPLLNDVEYAPLTRGEVDEGTVHSIFAQYSDPSSEAGTPSDVVPSHDAIEYESVVRGGEGSVAPLYSQNPSVEARAPQHVVFNNAATFLQHSVQFTDV